MRNATITIHKSALTHNLNEVRRLTNHQSKVLAMVKANAYGHGVTNVLPALLQADAFGVACMQEAEEVYSELTRLGLQEDIGICLIEGVFSRQEWIQAQEINAMCVVHCAEQLTWALAEKFTKQPIWLKVNTGMNRLGMNPTDAFNAYKTLTDAGYEVILCMHFANADEKHHPLNAQQLKVFDTLVEKIEFIIGHTPKRSVSNSASIVNNPDRHYDWVRPGIMLYGASPVIGKTSAELNLHTTMSFNSHIFAVYTVKQSDYIGYGSQWQAKEDTLIGVVAVGYGDGYPRTVNKAFVWCEKQRLPIIGRVSMDMLVVDLSNMDNIDNALNMPIELWGSQISIDELAANVGTISYELLCKVTQRPQRVLQ